MLIYKKIYQDYKNSMKLYRSSNDSKDHVEYITLNVVIGMVREKEKEYPESPRRAYVDKVVKPILINKAKQSSEMIDDLLKINSKDKKILNPLKNLKTV